MYIFSVQFYADLTTILSFCQIIVHCAIVGLFNVIYDSEGRFLCNSCWLSATFVAFFQSIWPQLILHVE